MIAEESKSTITESSGKE